jgi:hypothetical protein
MTINPPNFGAFQLQLTQAVLDVRNAMDQANNLNDYIVSEGGGTFLTGLGFSTADAAVVTSTFANLASLTAVYKGGTPGAAFNYRANGNLLWSGN